MQAKSIELFVYGDVYKATNVCLWRWVNTCMTCLFIFTLKVVFLVNGRLYTLQFNLKWKYILSYPNNHFMTTYTCKQLVWKNYMHKYIHTYTYIYILNVVSVVCDPPCQNDAPCVANDTCNCNTGFTGLTCDGTQVHNGASKDN